MHIGKTWTTIDRLSTIWKSSLSDRIKREFFHTETVLLLHSCTIWTLTRRYKKKLGIKYTLMLYIALNKSWKQHPTKHHLYGHLPPISQTIQVRRARHAGKRWTPTHGHSSVGGLAETYIHHLRANTGCRLEDLPNAMTNRD